MAIQTLILHVSLGLLLGAAIGYGHALASRRASERALARAHVGRLLLGFPLRVAIPGAGLFALTWLSLWALAAGLLAFWFGSRLALTRGRDAP